MKIIIVVIIGIFILAFLKIMWPIVFHYSQKWFFPHIDTLETDNYYANEYENFEKDKQNYPEILIQSLKENCINLENIWYQKLLQIRYKDENEYQSFYDHAIQRINFWRDAYREIQIEIKRRNLKNQ